MRIIAKGILLSACFLTSTLYAQNYVDAVRFSRPEDLGSARYMALGGAFSALGNDLSATSMNPAGIAVYRASEASFSTYFRATNTDNSYYGTSTSENDYQLRFSQFGIVMSSQKDNSSRVNIGLRYHRTNDYGFEQKVEGTNTDGSIVDQWIDDAIDFSPNSSDLFNKGLIYQQLAADVELMGFDPNTGWEQHAWGDNVKQVQYFESRGGKGVFGIDLGYQQDDEWHFGASLEFPTITYELNEEYSESNYDAASEFVNMKWTNNYQLNGFGVQLKIGALYTPEKLGRFSVYFHTPTYWSFEQQGSTSMESNDIFDAYFYSDQPFGRYNWTMFTPLKFGAGYAYVFNKQGLISIDYNVQNMSWASADGEFYGDLDEMNDNIDSELQTWHDFRIGTEWKFDNIFVRGGYHLTTSPFVTASPTSVQYSGGIGYKANKWGFDITYSLRKRTDNYYLYGDGYTDPTSRRISDNFFVTTLYFRM